MPVLDENEMGLEQFSDTLSQHRDAIFPAFAVADNQLILGKIEVFDTQL